MHIDDSSAMQILEEIKALMDSRMTDKMSMSDDTGDVASEIPDAKGIEMQKIKLLGAEGEEVPEVLKDDGSEDDDLMKKIRKELM